jgi:uncharacterized protein YrzB (UPF0473 family)
LTFHGCIIAEIPPDVNLPRNVERKKHKPLDRKCKKAYNRGTKELCIATKEDFVMANMENMENEELFTLTDEEGNESQFALIGQLELDDQIYLALIPAENEDADEYVVLKVEVDENGEETLVTIDDDEEFDRVADAFEDQFMGEFDLDVEEGSENV